MGYILRLLGAILLSVLLGFLFSVIAGEEQFGVFFFTFFGVGMVGWSIWLLRIRGGYRALFCFSLAFGIEWLALPLVLLVSAICQRTLEGLFGDILLLAIFLPISLGMGILSLFLALLVFKPRSRSTGK